jgi:hypothetical protein
VPFLAAAPRKLLRKQETLIFHNPETFQTVRRTKTLDKERDKGKGEQLAVVQKNDLGYNRAAFFSLVSVANRTLLLLDLTVRFVSQLSHHRAIAFLPATFLDHPQYACHAANSLSDM